jgi:septal ring factor EnvC (AmiA/AmiB activator)
MRKINWQFNPPPPPPKKKRTQVQSQPLASNKENDPPNQPAIQYKVPVSSSSPITNISSASTNHALLQVQDEFNKQREEFKKQQQQNANFDFRISKLESTTSRIDANVDRVLDLLENRQSNKAQRITENMQCETEDYSAFSHINSSGDNNL